MENRAAWAHDLPPDEKLWPIPHPAACLMHKDMGFPEFRLWELSEDEVQLKTVGKGTPWKGIDAYIAHVQQTHRFEIVAEYKSWLESLTVELYDRGENGLMTAQPALTIRVWNAGGALKQYWCAFRLDREKVLDVPQTCGRAERFGPMPQRFFDP